MHSQRPSGSVHPSFMNPSPEKITLRASARAARTAAAMAAPHAAARAAQRALPLIAPGAIVAVTWSMGDELDTKPLIDALRARGQEVALPVVVVRGQPLSFRRHRAGDRLLPGPLGTSHPADEAPLIQPAVLIVPLLAFDRRGYRLGYGGGFYDVTLRALRAKAAIRAIGFAYAGQEVPAVPHEAHDEKLDAIVTERETIEVKR